MEDYNDYTMPSLGTAGTAVGAQYGQADNYKSSLISNYGYIISFSTSHHPERQYIYYKPKASNGGAASLPAGCTPLCLKSSQLVRTASETNRKEPHSSTTPGVVSAEKQQQHQLSLAASNKPTAGDVAGDGQQHQLPDFGLSALVEPEVISTNHHQDPLSATVRDTSIQNAGRLS
ncbi:hypothetical protein DAPPUDRAFT_252015 [Daphnia pulex]|uniref:Uncharacterized protein n=1 Tax=Daphnia pulex TaxID=6669 RepID=E9H1R0_DAPPU|nr:hypothetical protein DAPPUDRAFT_252015 [Daphnia pulex]|eukprot:EFX74324.1 hypothetical protein DAPPUDRAFT_252015 [Daphnia pulex]